MPVDPEQRARLFNGDLDAVEAQARRNLAAMREAEKSDDEDQDEDE